jgi:hypothetical protein
MTGYAFDFLLLFLVDVSSLKSTHFVTHGSQENDDVSLNLREKNLAKLLIVQKNRYPLIGFQDQLFPHPAVLEITAES